MKKDTRFGHSEGITDITCTPDGGKIITCGADGDVRIWEGFSDDDPISFSASDSCFGVVVTTANEVIVGTENNAVEVYEYPKGKFLVNKLKFTGAANHLDVSKDGKYLVAGSADMTLQLTPMQDSTAPPIKVDAHSAPVLSVAIDSTKEFIASSGCDGSVCVWSFLNPNKLLKKWTQVFPSSNDLTTSPTLCRMAWDPSGKHLAVPAKDKIVIYNCDSWTEVKTLTCSKLTSSGLLSIVRFSSCGRFMAAGGSDGTVAIWDAHTYEIQAQIKESYHITGLTFNATSDQVLCTDSSGRLICIEEFVGSNSSSEQGAKGATDRETDSTNYMEDLAGLFDDDDDGENSFSITKIKEQVGFIDDQYVGPRKASKDTIKNGVDDSNDNDDAQSVSSLSSSKVARPNAPALAYNPFTVPQKPFQPSSTPESLEHRFMVWNNVGIIRKYSTEDEEFNDDAIDIEFHDESVHMPIHLKNDSDYTIGNMSSQVVVLGSPKSADERSKLYCLTFDIWDNSKEWTIDMPKGESIVGIAVGKGWIGAGTSQRRIRLFSVGGIQKFVYDFGGDLVAISGHENLLFVTYHNGVGTNSNQSISYSILKISGNSTKLTPLVLDACLPLSRAATLSWLGFTDEGTPAFADSSDVLRTLNGRLWSPFCSMGDHLSGPNDHFWVVGISELALHVRAVKCKGAKYPVTVPKPVIMILEAKVPLCEMDKEKNKLEDLILQSLLLSSISKKKEKNGFDMGDYKNQAEGKIKEHLMKLFTLSCEADRDFRAFEYVSMMPTSHAIQVATKYSSRLNRKVLTGHLHAVGRQKMEEENEAVEDEDDDFESSVVVTHVDHRYTTSGPELETSVMMEARGNSSFSSPATTPVIIIDDNPLLKKQKDQIRSILSPMGFRKNPFKKEKSKTVPNGSGNSNGTGLSRNSSFASSLAKNDAGVEDMDSQPRETGENGTEEISSSSKGVLKIDDWKKIAEKPTALPEFIPKNPNRKSRSSNNKAGGSEGAVGGKKTLLKKKSKDPDGKNPGKNQPTLFEMHGISSKSTNGVRNGNLPTSPINEISLNSDNDSSNVHNLYSNDEESENQNGDVEDTTEDAVVGGERAFSEITDKKRKRLNETDFDEGKKAKINDDQDSNSSF